MLEKSFGSDTGQEPPNGAESPPNPIWLPLQDTSKTISCLFSDRARRTISRYRALTKVFAVVPQSEFCSFASDAPLAPLPKPTSGVRKLDRDRDRDRAERKRLAGGPSLSLRERAVAFAKKKGEVRTKDLTDIGVHRSYLARTCDEGLLVRVGYGRYGVPGPKR